ncbi:hypothetical protein [Rhizobium sullae]|uniref:Uncharacterized protein n=1 Tax=Rhizobium sullae TaxID=50338 RepID=A0A4R3PXW5_RHISU|nr:hypothetical protein [Rhizobium sullae]TCU13321.1 hypothetical protein EV132_11219 [Rhizobium sullae]
MAESRNRISARSSILLLTLLRPSSLAILIALFEPVAALAHASLGRIPPKGRCCDAARAIVFEFNEAVAAQDYLPAIFGRGGFALVSDITKLPAALPAIYRELVY